jgi:uncharacterized protein
MDFRALPATAAWQHQQARSGFEVVFLRVADQDVIRCAGCTTAVEEGEAWFVEYAIDLDRRWRTRRAHVRGRAGLKLRETLLTSDGEGNWQVDGRAAPELRGCLDVDLESSALTNAFPVHRFAREVGATFEAPAAYVRALSLETQRLEQHYTRVDDDGEQLRFDYASPSFDLECRLLYDEAGLVVDYPGIAVRVA